MRIVMTLALALALGSVACATDVGPETETDELVVDKRKPAGTSREELLTDPCSLIVGMNVCTQQYIDAMFTCGYSICIAKLSHQEALKCGEAYAAGAAKDCGYVKREQEYCKSGITDPTTCSTGSGGSGSSTPLGNYCKWCNCYGGFSSYTGFVCGSSTGELLLACYNSCN